MTTHRLAAAFAAAALSASPLAAAAILSGPAVAQPTYARYLGPGSNPPEGVQPGLYDAQGRACVKQCPDDRNPCDPPSYKSADGRCSSQWR